MHRRSALRCSLNEKSSGAGSSPRNLGISDWGLNPWNIINSDRTMRKSIIPKNDPKINLVTRPRVCRNWFVWRSPYFNRSVPSCFRGEPFSNEKRDMKWIFPLFSFLRSPRFTEIFNFRVRPRNHGNWVVWSLAYFNHDSWSVHFHWAVFKRKAWHLEQFFNVDNQASRPR